MYPFDFIHDHTKLVLIRGTLYLLQAKRDDQLSKRRMVGDVSPLKESNNNTQNQVQVSSDFYMHKTTITAFIAHLHFK